MTDIISFLKFQGEISPQRIIAGVAILILLVIASVNDVKTRKIPSYCSYPIMLISLGMFIYDKEYILIPLFILAVLGTGNMLFRIMFIVFAVILAANKGEWLIPFMVSLVVGDIFFSIGIIGGGDAQLFFGLAAYAYKGWGFSVITAAFTVIAGLIMVLKNRKTNMKRFHEIIENMKKGKVKKDKSRIQIPFAVVLTLSALAYIVVQLL